MNKQKRKAKVFTNDKGVDWYVRIIETGERYGAPVRVEVGGDTIQLDDHAAVWGRERWNDGSVANLNDKAGVIFYDFEYANCGDFGPMGQQVSSYYIDTILEPPHGGLDLMGYEPKWKIDAATMDKVRTFLKAFTSD